MEVTSIQNGIIIDHVPAGTALKVLEYLKIDPSKSAGAHHERRQPPVRHEGHHQDRG